MKGLRRMTIEELVSEAYDIGHAHGTNPYRQLEGKRPRRVNDGWGQIAKEIERRFRELKKGKWPNSTSDSQQPEDLIMWFDPDKCPKCGLDADGVTEEILATALIRRAKTNDGRFVYGGESEIAWDTQEMKISRGQIVELWCPNKHNWQAKFYKRKPKDGEETSNSKRKGPGDATRVSGAQAQTR